MINFIDTDFNLQTGVPVMILTILLQAASGGFAGDIDFISLLIDKGLSLAVLAWFVLSLKRSLSKTIEAHKDEAKEIRTEHKNERVEWKQAEKEKDQRIKELTDQIINLKK